jgi:hypothetical protein
MAIGVLFEIPGGTKEQYEEMNQKMFGDEDPSPDVIKGCLVHTAGPSQNGWRIFDVWETRADFDRFMNETVMPALGEQEPAGAPPEIYELDRVMVAEGAPTT